jgi:hypothetical protein
MKRLILLIVCLFVSVVAHSASSPNVPIEDHVYREIDLLVSAGLIKDAIYGQRPWSRNEIARMIAQARRRYVDKGGISSDERNMATAIMAEYTIEQLEREYRDELAGNKSARIHWLEEASADAAYLDSPYRAVPENNGLGSIKAVVNPLVAYREGRHYADGGTFALESVHWATSQYFSIYAQPRFEGLIPGEGSSHADVRAQKLYGKFTLGNIEMEVGRDSLIWGSGEHGGVLASNNARNLDMVKISNDSPFLHPWIFKYLGPSKYTFFVADLGASYVYSDAYLYGLAVSFKPASFLEIGIEHQITVGGEGAPEVSFGDLVKEFFTLRGDIYGQNLTDHRIGLNVRAQIPQLHRAVIYGEGVFEDLGKESFWPQFTQQMGFLSGLYFPLLTADGSNDLRIEYEHVPAAYGRHGMWTSGLTEDDVLRGSELGPDGHGIHVTWRRLFPSGTQWKNAVHYENRDSNLYTASPSSSGGPDEIIQVEDRPSESRFRVTTSLEWTTHEKFVVRPEFGYEHVWNFDFATGSNRNNFLAAVSLRWFPGFK